MTLRENILEVLEKAGWPVQEILVAESTHDRFERWTREAAEESRAIVAAKARGEEPVRRSKDEIRAERNAPIAYEIKASAPNAYFLRMGQYVESSRVSIADLVPASVMISGHEMALTLQATFIYMKVKVVPDGKKARRNMLRPEVLVQAAFGHVESIPLYETVLDADVVA